MVWGGFTKYGVGPIVLITGKLDSVPYQKLLDNYLVPFLEDLLLSVYTTAVVQQENPLCHKSRSVIQWLQHQAIPLLKWHRVQTRRVMALKLKTMYDLWAVIQQEWQKIANDICADLVSSMSR